MKGVVAYTNSAANTLVIIVVVQVVLSFILTVEVALLPLLLVLQHPCSFDMGRDEVM